MMVAEDEPVAAGRLLQPKIEAEVAFLLDRDVDVEAPTIADVLRAVAYAMPALEIVGSRITNWDYPADRSRKAAAGRELRRKSRWS
jgi:2-keto-4-pentenoate hydratase